uniref:Uncharacterized protein n=1 Tax=Micrurus surinamensis TaxID=129470 RepID=A0A2D4PBE7_MICSU
MASSLVQGDDGTFVKSSMRLVQSFPAPPPKWRSLQMCWPASPTLEDVMLEGSQPVGKVWLIHGWPVKKDLSQPKGPQSFEGPLGFQSRSVAEGVEGHLTLPG